MVDIKLEESWQKALDPEFIKPYMLELKRFLLTEKAAGKIIYPEDEKVFAAFNLTPFDEVKVVILGQDPYHGAGQAHGLCFSVPKDIPIPPSLLNIYKELAQDLNISRANHGCLRSWAKQGILLLNSVLTVEKDKAGSHAGRGWEEFTDTVIRKLNARAGAIIFVLWGNYARKKASLIDNKHHYILQSAHPSPLSASRGFLGNQHFSTINNILCKENLAPINWQLPAQT
jgi:uracil-DNA glycosylase